MFFSASRSRGLVITGCATAVLLAGTSGADAAVGAVRAADPTVTFTVVAADGSPLPSGRISISDTDSLMGDYPGTATVKDGQARVKLPKGHYSAFGVDKTGTAANRVTRIVPITDFTVAAKPVELTVDYRRADQRPSVSVPRAVTRKSLSVSWSRFDIDTGLPVGPRVSVGSGGDILVAPETRAKVGRVSVTYTWQLAQPGSVPAYTYDLAVNTDGFRAAPAYTFAPADLATVTSSYYGAGGPARTGEFRRYASFTEDSGFGPTGTYQPVTRGTRRIEYVGSHGSIPLWSETALADSSGQVKDPGRTDALNKQPILAGAHQTRAWFRGPVTPGVPTFRYQNGGLCLACQGKKALELLLSPTIDSVSDHVGLMKNSSGSPSVARFRAYRDGRKIKDSKRLAPLDGWDAGLLDDAEPPFLGGRIATPAASARYQVVLDVNRRAQNPGVSTVTHTTVGFSSRPGHGALPPSDWGCITSEFNCRVLPLLMAHLSMPLRLDGTLPAGRSTLTLKAARIQHATRAKITAVTLSVRPAGQTKWRNLQLHPAGKGTYSATIDNTAWAGSAIDVRYSAKDAGGSTFTQTVQRAYVVGPAHPSCNRPGTGQVACFSTWTSLQPVAANRVSAAAKAPITGLTPANLRAAYGLRKTGGKGLTIGIVVANDYPKVEKDLAVYRSRFHLGACTIANKCLRKVDQRGGRQYPAPDAGWATEAALDVQSVSAVCPKCHILLVEADYPEPDYMSMAVATAVRLGADVVSNSYGIPEFPGMLSLGQKYLTHPKVPILAATGDIGNTQSVFPAALPGVWAIGGTTLKHTRTAGWQETAWRHGGSGCSVYAARPAGQHSPDCKRRTTADISVVADAHQKFAVYDTYGLGVDDGWIGLTGTSLSSPVVAGMMGLAGHPAKVADPAYAYRHPKAYTDIVTGANGYCQTSLCQAGPGYDGPTGLGSPHHLDGL